MAGLRLLGGSSRFAQVQTTSCGSSKSMVCWLGGSSRFAQQMEDKEKSL
ncbi:MAG: hypothetical protein IKX30_04055 [Victivallales bacterium]|nr:hypothetical protein [Victivallales bacterium]